MTQRTPQKGGKANEIKGSDLMTDAEVADLLRVSTATLRRYLRDKKSPIQIIRRVNVGQRRWVREAVMHFINGK
jgi:predicted site-specific integrase-resolvase